MSMFQSCAVLGQHPMTFSWGFDEEDEGCSSLKLDLAQQIMTLRQQGVTRFHVVADCGIGLYAGEIINVLRENDPAVQLFCVTPHEEQSSKWAPYLRERYFSLLIRCTHMEAIDFHKTPECTFKAYQRIIERSDVVLAVCDPADYRGSAAERAILYAAKERRPIIQIWPDKRQLQFAVHSFCLGGDNMIERLYPDEFPFGEPDYSKLEHQIQELKETLALQLDASGQETLRKLSDAFLRQSHHAVKSAFTEGVRAGARLMDEIREPL